MKPKSRACKSAVGSTLAGVVVLSFASVVSSHASLWTGTAADNNWNNLANWDSNPTGGIGEVNNLTNIPIITVANTLVPNDLKIATANPNSTGQVDIRSGTFAINYWAFIGDWAGNGTLNIAAGTNASPGAFTGLDQGSGSFTNTANGNGNFMVGLYNSTGVVNMNTSGSLNASVVRLSPNGQGGSATFNLDNGTVNTAFEFQVGSDYWGANTNSPAYLNMSDGTINAGGEFWIGGSGSGTGTMTGGTISSGAWFVIGRNNGSNGSFTMSGGTVTAATTTVGSFPVIGSFSGSQGTLNVNGGLFQSGSDRKMLVGETGTGTLNLSGSGHVLINNNVTGDGFRLGVNSGGAGTVNLNGGTLEVAYIAKGAGTGTFNFNGGTLKTAGNHNGTNPFMSGLTSANVLSGGAVIDTNGIDTTIGQALLDGGGGGGLTKQGSGKLTLTAANTYTGTTTVNGGSLVLSGNDPTAATIVNDGNIDSNGTFTTLTVADLATNKISAGAGAAGSFVADTLNFQGDAQISLRASGTSTDQFILVDTALTTTPANGVVSVNVNNTLGIWTADPTGWDYTIIDHGGTYTGNAATDFAVGTITPALGVGQTAVIADTGTKIVLRVSGDPLAWTGNSSGNWNTTDINWTTTATGPSPFTEGQGVLFADGASVFNVNLAGDVAPGTITFGNLNDDYILSSTGGFGITGSASVLLNGGGQVTIGTDNSYTGLTSIFDGKLIVSGSGSIASSSSIILGTFGELIFDLSTADEYANPITGSGIGITKQGSGALTLSGANTFSGNFTLNAGQLNLNSAGALGTGPGLITINGGTLDNTSGGTIAVGPNKAQTWNSNINFLGSNTLFMSNGEVFITGDRSVNVAANTLGVGAVVDSGAGYDLVKTGIGTLVLNGGNIAGNLDIQDGIVGINQNFYGAAPIGTGVLQNAGNVGSRWTHWNIDEDVSSNLLIRNNDGSHNFQLGLIKRGPDTLTLTNGSNAITSNVNVDQGRLVLNNAGTYGARNDDGSTNTNLNSFVGWDAGANAVLEINGATVNYNNRANPGTEAWRESLTVSNTGTGAGSVILNSGNLSINSQLALGWASGGFGAMTQTGGSATVGGFVTLGVGGSRAVLDLSGGSLTHNGPITVSSNNATGVGIVNLHGNAAYNCNNTSAYGFWIGENGRGELNISDSATLTLAATGSGLTLGNATGSSGVVNLRGGNLTAKTVVKGGGTGVLNFDGGRLTANAASGTFLTGITAGYVNAGGGTISNGGNAITIGQALLAPSGGGVTSAGLTPGGGGLIAPPVVTITGDGSGATAVANIDAGGNLTGITITNPGVGYTNASLTLAGGGIGNTANVGGSPAIQNNISGGMTFTGSAITTLNGVNTYTGNTTINSGTTVVVGNLGALTVKPAADNVSSKITGAGTVSIDGTLRIDLSEAAVANGNSWILVDAAMPVFNLVTFKVSGVGLGDFTAQGDGVNHKLEEGNNTWTFNETTGELSLAVAAGGGFESWIGGFDLDPADQGSNDDPDDDGVLNLLEYVLGRDPSVSDGASSNGVRNGANLELTFSRSDLAVTNADAAILIEYGDDLTGWTEVAVPAADGAVGGVNFTITGASPNDTVLASIPTAGATMFFARVKAVK